MEKKVYVAGSWEGRERVSKYIEMVRKVGYTITHDWSVVENTHSPEKDGEYARKDIQGVVDADFLVVIFDNPEYVYRGTYTEIGCALGLKKVVLAFCPDEISYCKTNVFYYHPDIKHFDNWGDLLRAIRES